MLTFSGASRSSFNACEAIATLAYSEEIKCIRVRVVDSAGSGFTTFPKSSGDALNELIYIVNFDSVIGRSMPNTALYAIFRSL
jgi:hypothetical protein